MSDQANITDSRAYRVFTAVMTLVGIYAAIRHGGQWAYELGKLVGAN